MIPTPTRRYLSTAILAVIVLPFVVFAVPQLVGASGSYVVVSNSMTPQFHSGDAVFVYSVPPSQIEAGDVITYRPPGGREVTTHQVVAVVEQDGERQFRTKGLANEEPDPYLVPPAAVVGVVKFHVPYLGLAISLLGTQYGMLAFIIVPSFLLIVTELWDLGREIRQGTERTDSPVPDDRPEPDPTQFQPYDEEPSSAASRDE